MISKKALRQIRVMLISTVASSQSGATHLLFQTAKTMDTVGFSTLVVLPSSLDILLPGEVRFMLYPMLRPRRVRDLSYQMAYLFGLIPNIWSLCNLIRSQKINLVHVNEILDLQCALAAWLCRVPLVWNIRASLPFSPAIAGFLSRFSVRLATKIIVASVSVQCEMYGWYANADNKIEVLYDPPRFIGSAERQARLEWRQRLGIAPEAPLVGLVSKLQNGKGHRWLIEAVPTLAKQHPELRVAIAGTHVEGHEQDAIYLYDLAKQLDPDKHIIFTGQIDNVLGFLSACDIVVHCPDYNDPFPGVVLEAMIAEKPVVGSRVGGIPEQIADGITGLLVDPASPTAIAEAIGRLLANPSIGQRMGKSGRERVLSTFSAEAYGKRLTETYLSLLNKQGKNLKMVLSQ